jgi:hypothetical protein
MSRGAGEAVEVTALQEARWRAEAARWQRRAEAAETALAAAYSGLAKKPGAPPEAFLRTYTDLKENPGQRFVCVEVGNGRGVVLDRDAISDRSAGDVWEELRPLLS